MDAFIARQPILNKKQQVVSYELLFRDGIENFFRHSDASEASGQVMANSVLLFGISRVTSGKKAFINITRELLLEDKFLILPRELFSIELLEDINIDETVISACRNLKKRGYLLVIDDFVEQEGIGDLVQLADIIKIDVLANSYEEQADIMARYRTNSVSFLAEKIETREVFEKAVSMGYEYFQDFFFKKPVLISHKDIPGYKHHYLKLMGEISRAALNFDQIEELIKNDISLTYKLLRYINSAFFGLRVEIKSIRHALAVLGEKEIRKWVCLLSMGSMAEDKPPELLISSTLRARFCELLAPVLGIPDKSQDLFLLGLFSLIDGIMDRPLEEAIREIPLTGDMKNALLGKPSPWADPLALIVAYENGDWRTFAACSARLKCDEEKIPERYIAAISWVDESMAALQK